MFDQLVSLLKEAADNAVEQHPEVSADQKAAVTHEAVNSISGTLQNAISGGNIQQLAGLFSGSGDNGNLAQNISGDFVNNLTAKLGITSGAAQSIGASIIPAILEKLKSLIGGTNGGGMDLSSILSSLTSSGALDQNKDGKVDLNDAIDFLKGSSSGSGGIGGMLKGMFGK